MLNLDATRDNGATLIYLIDMGCMTRAWSEEGSRRGGLVYGKDHDMVEQVRQVLQSRNRENSGRQEDL